ANHRSGLTNSVQPKIDAETHKSKRPNEHPNDDHKYRDQPKIVAETHKSKHTNDDHKRLGNAGESQKSKRSNEGHKHRGRVGTGVFVSSAECDNDAQLAMAIGLVENQYVQGDTNGERGYLIRQEIIANCPQLAAI